jgi:hypothetical protein
MKNIVFGGLFVLNIVLFLMVKTMIKTGFDSGDLLRLSL